MSAALEALSPELARLDLLLHCEILRLRARYQLSLDEFRGLYVSDEQVERLLAEAPRENDDYREYAERAMRHLRDIASRDLRAPKHSRWLRLAHRLSLSRAERDVVLLSLAPEIDAKYETLYAYLNNDVTRKLPTLELAARLFADTPEAGLAVRGLMAPTSTLASLGVLEFAPSTSDAARAQRGLRVAQPLIDWLLGFDYEDKRLKEFCRLPASTTGWSYARETAADGRLATLLQKLSDGQDVPQPVLLGTSAAEAANAATAILRGGRRRCVLLDLEALGEASGIGTLVTAAGLMSRVLDFDIVASPLESLRRVQGGSSSRLVAALESLRASGCRLVIAGARGTDAATLVRDRFRTMDIDLPELDVAARARIWRAALNCPKEDLPFSAVADRFNLGADGIEKAARAVLDRASLNGGQLDAAGLFAAARAVSGQDDSGGTKRISTTLDWDDLVLPSPSRRRLQDLIDTVEHRHRVLDQWGFSRRMSGARGVKALFAGASGTGKTMAASLIAQRLGSDLHRVEIAAVVSKYIGETEKNLDRAFDSARRANAILFIDEADALFGKRSEVKDAHDRYANVETAYLLQKMEDHDGVVILATNLKRNIDESFSRRMQFVVEFPMPDAATREQLWRGMFPADAPVTDLDFGFLARQFEFTGGAIRNIVLEAAYAAAAADTPIDMQRVLRAVAQEYSKRGKVPGAAEFREFFSLLSQHDESTGQVQPAPSSSGNDRMAGRAENPPGQVVVSRR